MKLHIHVDGSFSKERGNCCAYGFLVFDDEGRMLDFQLGRLALRRPMQEFEIAAATKALDFVVGKYGDHQIALFTDCREAAIAVNNLARPNICAQQVNSNTMSGYLFINNLRAHSLAIGVVRKNPTTNPPQNLPFEERFKQWIHGTPKKTKVCFSHRRCSSQD